MCRSERMPAGLALVSARPGSLPLEVTPGLRWPATHEFLALTRSLCEHVRFEPNPQRR